MNIDEKCIVSKEDLLWYNRDLLSILETEGLIDIIEYSKLDNRLYRNSAEYFSRLNKVLEDN